MGRGQRLGRERKLRKIWLSQKSEVSTDTESMKKDQGKIKRNIQGREKSLEMKNMA